MEWVLLFLCCTMLGAAQSSSVPLSCKECFKNQTCCVLGNGANACCPFANGVCCLDFSHCCPQHTICDLANRTCVIKQVETVLVQLSRLPSFENQTMCASSKMKRCCPLPDATCCSHAMTCCPSGCLCDTRTSHCICHHGLPQELQKSSELR